MKLDQKIYNLPHPRDQLNLYGYAEYFNYFKKLYISKKLPNVILLNGNKGLGKATFVYHFTNFILSDSKSNEYSIDNFSIKSDSATHKLICGNIHPNFFLLDNPEGDEKVKISQTRNLISFLNKSTHNRNLKIVIIDNVEFLNVNSSNALLKSLEEPSLDTYYFIINSNTRILETIKSRSIQFDIFLDKENRKKILTYLLKDDFPFIDVNMIEEKFYFDTPGNILKYLSIFKDTDIDITRDFKESIFYLLEFYKKDKSTNLINALSTFLEILFNQMSINNIKNVNKYFYTKHKTLNIINNMKKFNLDKNNFISSLSDVINHEAR